MQILSSVDQMRLERRVAELIAAGVAPANAKRRARNEIGKARAAITRGATANWADTILTRVACAQ